MIVNKNMDERSVHSEVMTEEVDSMMEDDFDDDDPIEMIDGSVPGLAPVLPPVRLASHSVPVTPVKARPRIQLERDIALLMVKSPDLKLDYEQNGILRQLKKLTDEELEELMFNLELQKEALKISQLGGALALGLGTVMEKNTYLPGLCDDIAGDMEIRMYLGSVFEQFLPYGTNIWGFFVRVGLHLQTAICRATSLYGGTSTVPGSTGSSNATETPVSTSSDG